MRIDRAIAEMRRDRTLQRRAQRRMKGADEAWRGLPQIAPVLADLERYGSGTALADCDALRNVFCGDNALEIARSATDLFARELNANPLGLLPFRHSFDGTVSTLLLAKSGRAQLILHSREPGASDYTTAGFSDAERYEVVLAGAGEAQVVQRSDLGAAPLALRPGESLTLDLSHAALQVLSVGRRLVSLRLHRFCTNPGPSREYRLADGAMIHQSSGDMRASRQEMMLALLGRMGRTDAAPVMAEIASEPGDDSLRWQALRECLALDTATGWQALSALSCDPADPLAAHAGAVRAQLGEAHPQLLALEDERCPA
ncbi:MAG: hypothetical protein ABIT16_07325 [Croceibacterium sp.]